MRHILRLFALILMILILVALTCTSSVSYAPPGL